jgi:hypothetical protein
MTCFLYDPDTGMLSLVDDCTKKIMDSRKIEKGLTSLQLVQKLVEAFEYQRTVGNN